MNHLSNLVFDPISCIFFIFSNLSNDLLLKINERNDYFEELEALRKYCGIFISLPDYDKTIKVQGKLQKINILKKGTYKIIRIIESRKMNKIILFLQPFKKDQNGVFSSQGNILIKLTLEEIREFLKKVQIISEA